MSEAIFSYQGLPTIVQCNQEESMRYICAKFANKVMENIDELYFIYGGQALDLNLKFSEVASKEDQQAGKMNITAELNENINLKEKETIIPNEIICPTCKEHCRFKIKDSKITLYECQNKHENENIILDQFYETQAIDESNIICDHCKANNKQETFENKFYVCLACSKNLCPICKSKHDKSHNIIDYAQKYFICKYHNEIYDSYCDKCKYNICFQCLKDHEEHKDNIISFKVIVPNSKTIEEDMNKFRTQIDSFFGEIDKMINILNNIKNKFEKYYEIQKKIIDNFDLKKRNYQILNNMNNIPQNNESIISDINKIMNEDSISNKFIKLIEMYETINDFKKFSLKYKINKGDEKVKIFGEKFVANNKDNFKIIYQDKIFDLMEYFDLKNKNNDDDTLEIYLKQINHTNNISYMFNKCSTLISLPELSGLKTNNIIKMNSIFSQCSSLSELPDISNWNTSKVSDMNYLFYKCSSLTSLPDLSKWDTGNVKYMDSMFSTCSKLNSLPDISKWNMENVRKINHMFYHCSSLKSLPDLSNWNTKNIREINSIFSNCSSLESLPDISKWNTEKVTLMNHTFFSCSSLTSLPDISIWNTENVTLMNNMFSCCSKLSSLPDISKWNTKKVTDMSYMFCKCSSLSVLPDINIWDISNVKNVDSMLYGCSSLKQKPDLSYWEKNSQINIETIFKKIKQKKEEE